MRKSLEQLIEISKDVQVFLGIGSFELHFFEDGSYTEFRVYKVNDVAALVAMVQGLRLSLYHNDIYIIVRVEEDFTE